MEPTATKATAPLEVDRVCAWQEEMRCAVRGRESLPAAACGAIARLLQRFLDEETADEDGSVNEVRAAIALLNEASQRNRCSLGARVTPVCNQLERAVELRRLGRHPQNVDVSVEQRRGRDVHLELSERHALDA